MQIDWITVIAQIVNFLILVYLLKRFLYRPVIAAMNGRQQRIAERLDQADRRERQAEEENRQYLEKTEELDRQRESTLENAKKEAAEERERLINEARAEVAQMRDEWIQDLQREQQDLQSSLKKQMGDNAVAIARQAIGDLADDELEAQVGRTFAQKLRELDADSLNRLSEAEAPIRIYTGFEAQAGSPWRQQVEGVLHERVDRELEIEWRRRKDLICGVQLVGAGLNIGWSVDEYLDGLEQQIGELVTGLGKQPEQTGEQA